MRDLVIIGAGNVGAFLAYNMNLFDERFNILGFLDDDPSKPGADVCGAKVLGNTRHLYSLPTAVAVVVCVASPEIRKKIVDDIEESGHDLPSFISRNAWVSNGVLVGKGVIVYPGVSINHESVLEDFVIINMNCVIGHNCHISKCSTLAPGVNLAGFTRIGEAVDMGIGVSTRQNIVVGDHSVVGGQSMLVRDVQPGSTIVGVPGKVLRTRPAVEEEEGRNRGII